MTARLIRIIVNPISGCGGRDELPAQIERGLAQRGYQVEISPTLCAGDATRLASQAANTAEAVIAIGGDGTVRETATGLIGSSTRMVIAPCGTENLVAKYYGLTPHVDAVVATLESGRTADIDVVRANGRPFLVVAGFGFDAEVVQ